MIPTRKTECQYEGSTKYRVQYENNEEKVSYAIVRDGGDGLSGEGGDILISKMVELKNLKTGEIESKDEKFVCSMPEAFFNKLVADGPCEEGECGEEKESQFLKIETSKGVFTVVNYNEHNGYYGGFCVRCATINP